MEKRVVRMFPSEEAHRPVFFTQPEFLCACFEAKLLLLLDFAGTIRRRQDFHADLWSAHEAGLLRRFTPYLSRAPCDVDCFHPFARGNRALRHGFAGAASPKEFPDFDLFVAMTGRGRR